MILTCESFHQKLIIFVSIYSFVEIKIFCQFKVGIRLTSYQSVFQIAIDNQKRKLMELNFILTYSLECLLNEYVIIIHHSLHSFWAYVQLWVHCDLTAKYQKKLMGLRDIRLQMNGQINEQTDNSESLGLIWLCQEVKNQ